MKKVIASQVANRILVRQSEAETKQGMFEIPDTLAIQPLRGEVVATSDFFTKADGSKLMPVVRVGDIVLYNPQSGCPVEANGETLLVMDEHQIFLIL